MIIFKMWFYYVCFNLIATLVTLILIAMWKLDSDRGICRPLCVPFWEVLREVHPFV